MYNYMEVMTNNIITYIRDEVDTSQYTGREELEEFLNDELWVCDDVTGNGSGSYTFNTYRARAYVLDNLDLLSEMCLEFGVSNAEIGHNLLNGEWEWMDVSIRCYLLGQAISAALDQMEGELVFDTYEEEEDEE